MDGYNIVYLLLFVDYNGENHEKTAGKLFTCPVHVLLLGKHPVFVYKINVCLHVYEMCIKFEHRCATF